MEMNYVYGMKNVQRAPVPDQGDRRASERLTGGNVLSSSPDLREVPRRPISSGIAAHEQFNVAFPIYWRDILSVSSFIRTALSPDDPLIRTFLSFSQPEPVAAYHVLTPRILSAGQRSQKMTPTGRYSASRGGPKRAKPPRATKTPGI